MKVENVVLELQKNCQKNNKEHTYKHTNPFIEYSNNIISFCATMA